MKVVKNSDYYVYLLYDTQTKEIFYVGKGKGMRFYNHIKEAQKNADNDIENEKLKRIKQIGEKRVGCTILRRNISETEALQVEAAAIDILRFTNYKNINIGILNKQSGHGIQVNGMLDIIQLKGMNKYVELMKTETLLCLNIKQEELTKLTTDSLVSYVHKKKCNVKPEEAKLASYIVVECGNVVIEVFNSYCWNKNTDGKTYSFGSNRVIEQSVLDRIKARKLPKRKQGTPQVRYINYTDILLAKKPHLLKNN